MSEKVQEVIEQLKNWAKLDTREDCPTKSDIAFQVIELLRKAYPENPSAREECLHKAAEIVCGEREGLYGSPENSFATVAAFWTAYLKCDINAEDVAMMMALLKIARISTGVYKADSYIDIAGYAACGMEIAKSNLDCADK